MKRSILALCAAGVICSPGCASAHDEKTKTATARTAEDARVARCINFLTTFGLATGKSMGLFEKIQFCHDNPEWGSNPGH